MSVLLPVFQDGARFQFACELETITYTFTFRWNERDSAWFMDMGDGAGTPIVTGIKVSLNLDLLAQTRATGLPTGLLMAFDTSDTDTEAGFADLGLRVKIYYYTAAEVRTILLS